MNRLSADFLTEAITMEHRIMTAAGEPYWIILQDVCLGTVDDPSTDTYEHPHLWLIAWDDGTFSGCRVDQAMRLRRGFRLDGVNPYVWRRAESFLDPQSHLKRRRLRLAEGEDE